MKYLFVFLMSFSAHMFFASEEGSPPTTTSRSSLPSTILGRRTSDDEDQGSPLANSSFASSTKNSAPDANRSGSLQTFQMDAFVSSLLARRPQSAPINRWPSINPTSPQKTLTTVAKPDSLFDIED